jgi:hypothetical protein
VLAARLGRAGLTHDMQYCSYDAAPKPEPKPLPAPRVAATPSGEAGWLRTVSATELRFEARTRDGAVAVAPLNEVHGERYAVYWQFDSDAPGQG